MEKSGKFNLNNCKTPNLKSKISINHEKIRLNKKIINLEENLSYCNNELNIYKNEIDSLNKQLVILGERYNKCLEDNKIYVDNINNNNIELNNYKLEKNDFNNTIKKYTAKINLCDKKIQKLLEEKKDIYDEKEDILKTKEELKNSDKTILKSKILDKIIKKKEIVLPALIRNYRNKIESILNMYKKYYETWLNIFIEDWNGDKNNIFSLSGNRNIDILKKFGYNTNFLKNGIPDKIIEEPNDGWKLYNSESLNFIIKDYICFKNILLKSCPGCDDFVINKGIDISIKNLFDAVSICIPSNYNSNEEQVQLLNSNYSNSNYWSNYKDNIDKSIICSKNIITIKDKINDLENMSNDINCFLNNMDNYFEDFILETINYKKMESLWDKILHENQKIYDIISKQFTNISENCFLKDHIFIQVDFVKFIDKKEIIQWIREVPLVYFDSISGPLVFGDFKTYDVTNYLITNINGYVDLNEEKTYQLAGEYGNLFKRNIDESNMCDNINIILKQTNNVPINDRWEVIKTSDQYRSEILNKDIFNISKININFTNILNDYTKFKILFCSDFEYINM